MTVSTITVYGRAVWDDWRDIPSSSSVARFGGPGANVAVHLAALGFHVHFVTAFGTDAFSAAYKGYLRDKGVDTSYSRTFEGNLPRVAMWLRKPGRYFAKGNDGFRELKLVDCANPTGISDAVVFVDFPMQGRSELAITRRAYSAPHITLTNGWTSKSDLCRLQWRVVFLNRLEADSLGGDAEVGRLSVEFGNTWIITQGAEPTICFVCGARQVVTPPLVPCINPVGGGDAFAAGVIAGLERGEGMARAIRHGHAAASIVVGEIGCQSDRMSWAALNRLAVP